MVLEMVMRATDKELIDDTDYPQRAGFGERYRLAA